MPIRVFALILVAAALHATWNALVKSATDKVAATIMVATTAGVLAGLILPFLPPPARESWPFISISAVCETLYYVLLANTYRHGDMSRVYPLMRGSAPLLVAAAGVVLIGEPLSIFGWIGIAVVSFGVIGLAASPGKGSDKTGILFALGNAVVIAAYTLIDGLGVRRSMSPLAYTMWIFLLPAIPLAIWAASKKRGAFGRSILARLPTAVVGGIATMVSYGLALWAMTFVPVALVAALRETSILFAVAISALILKEKVGLGRIAMACFIALGAAILRLA